GRRDWRAAPFVVDVPALVRVDVDLSDPTWGDWRGALSLDDTVPLDAWTRQLVLEPGLGRLERPVVHTRTFAAATVRGRFPLGSLRTSVSVAQVANGPMVGLSMTAAVDPDGAFESPGLDPATYRVQCFWTEP